MFLKQIKPNKQLKNVIISLPIQLIFLLKRLQANLKIYEDKKNIE